MSLNVYNNELCTSSYRLKTIVTQSMSEAYNSPTFTIYSIPTSSLLVTDILSIYIGVKELDGSHTTTKLNHSQWAIDTNNNRVTISVGAELLNMYNIVFFVPVNCFNICFTGTTGAVIESKRKLYLKRDSVAYIYDYLGITSLDIYGIAQTPLEFPDVSFTAGIGTGFTNLTSDYLGAQVEFDGSYIGDISEVTGVNSLELTTSFTSDVPSRAFIYTRGTLEFAFDINGAPGAWSKFLNLPTIDTDEPFIVWVKDVAQVTEEMVSFPNSSIRVIGTEFLA